MWRRLSQIAAGESSGPGGLLRVNKQASARSRMIRGGERLVIVLVVLFVGDHSVDSEIDEVVVGLKDWPPHTWYCPEQLLNDGNFAGFGRQPPVKRAELAGYNWR